MAIRKIQTAKLADGWRSRVWYVAGYAETIFTAPDGAEYVIAKNGEQPDLLYAPKNGAGLPPVPLRLRENSSLQRKHTRHARKLRRKHAK